jgi:hypothetical protein
MLLTVEGDGRVKAELRVEQMNREMQKMEKAGFLIVMQGLRRDDDCSICIMYSRYCFSKFVGCETNYNIVAGKLTDSNYSIVTEIDRLSSMCFS